MEEQARRFFSKLRELFRQGHTERGLDEELAVHLDLLAERYVRDGMSAQEATRAARRQFGNTTLLKQRHREARTTMFFAKVGRDVRFGWRQLAKTPVFTVVCVATLALGVGANTAVFSVMHAVLRKMLPIEEASRVFYVHTSGFPNGATQTGDETTSFSYPVYRALRQEGGLAEVMAFIPLSTNGKVAVRAGSAPEEVAGDMVSGNYFRGLGVGMELGRALTVKDEEEHAAVVVISRNFWATHYGRSREVLGRPLYVKSVPFTIVGVAAKGFEGTEGRLPLDLWIPLQSRPDFNAWGSPPENGMYLTDEKLWSMKLMVRTAAGVSREEALARARVVFARVAYTGIAPRKAGTPELRLTFEEAKQFDWQDASLKQALRALMAMVGLVLLIAMSNVAMLLLARNANRQREFAVRLALGAGRWEIARQLLSESLLLVTLGGAAAWALALGATRALGAWAQIESDLQPDRVVMAFTLGVLLVLAVTFGLTPLRAALESRPEMVQRSTATASQGSTQRTRLGNAVMVAQIAMCLVLLVGAGLLLGSLRNLMNIPLGQKAEGLLVFGVHPAHVQGKEERVAFFTALQQRMRSLPGVEDATLTYFRPGSGWSSNYDGITVDGHKPNGAEAADASYRQNWVGADYFRTMRVPVVEGRDFAEADTMGAAGVLIVNETYAKKYLGTVHAVGHFIGDGKGEKPRRIVGVVKDHKFTGITEDPMPMVWNAFMQEAAMTEGQVEMRVAGDPLAMVPTARRVVREMDADLPLLEPMAQSEVFAQSVSQQVLFARLAGCFGVLAVVLIATGLYGTLAYRVERRSAEIGVRMALGAKRGQVVWMVLRGSLLLSALGVAAGVPLAMAAGRALESSLYGLKPLDPASYALAILCVGLVALVASAVPAGRAASVDPLRALRAD